MNIFLQKIDNFFEITKRGSTLKREFLGGLTTFLAINYILLVTPQNLQVAKLQPEVIFTTTAISIIITTLIMGLYAKYPITIVPGLGMQAFFSYTIVLTMGYKWQEGLLATFISGIIFFLLSISGLRKYIIKIIPSDIKNGMALGLGFFIIFIGLKSVGIIVSQKATIVSLGNLHNPTVIIALLGILLTIILFIKKVKSYIFISMIVLIILTCILQLNGINMGITFTGQIISIPHGINSTFLSLFNTNIWKLLMDINFWIIIISIFFIDFFDTAGTLLAVQKEMGNINDTGEIKTSNKIYLVDSLGVIVNSLLGVTSSATAVESITGIKEGAKTGFSSLVVAFLFTGALFFSGILTIVIPAVTAPALVLVGLQIVMTNFKFNDKDLVSTLSSVFMSLLILLTFSIAEGFALGIIIYTVLKIAEGKYKELNPFMYILTIFFITYFWIK